MSVTASEKYYVKAFSQQMAKRWEGIKEISGNTSELESLAYYRTLTAFYGKDAADVQARRDVLYAYLAPNYNTEDVNSDLNLNRAMLPINTSVRNLVKTLCTAYNDAPKRNFGDLQEALQSLYDQALVNAEMKTIYRKAKLCGLVAVRPAFRQGRLTLLHYTPDEFRVFLDEEKQPRTLIYVDTMMGEKVYRVWNADILRTLNVKGKVIGELTHSYGRLPFVFLRLGENKNFYEGGLFEIVEENIKANEDEFDANLSRRYHAHPIGLAINMGADVTSISPGKFIYKDNVRAGEGQDVEPIMQYVSPDGRYVELKEFAEMRLQSAMRNEGVPASVLTNQSGVPLSGIARVIERSDLIEERYTDIERLRGFERDLAELVVLVSNTDAQTAMSLKEFSVDYAEEQVLLDPDVEYEFDKKKMQDGVLDPLEFVRKWGGIDRQMGTNDVIKMIQERKQLLKELGYGQQTVPTQTAEAVTESGASNISNANPQP